MPTSLAVQLAQNVSLNAPLLSETQRKKHFSSSSYLFSATSNTQIDDLDSIHALSLNAITQLRNMFPSLAPFNDAHPVYQAVFSPRARDTDRTLLPPAERAETTNALHTLLDALGPCLLEPTAGRVIEWLVRRFRVNELDAPAVISLFLPYHDAPHCAKMLSILTLDGPVAHAAAASSVDPQKAEADIKAWAPLVPYKVPGTQLTRAVLAAMMRRHREFARRVVGLLPDALNNARGAYVHRTLVCFNTAVLLEYITDANKKELDASTLAFLLPALTEPLKTNTQVRSLSQSLLKDTILGSYVLLSALSQKVTFTQAAVKSIIHAMVHSASSTTSITSAQLLTALIAFMNPQETLDVLPKSIVDPLIKLPGILDALRTSLKWSGLDKVILPMLNRLVMKRTTQSHAKVLDFLLSTERVPRGVLRALLKTLLAVEEVDGAYTSFLAATHQRYPELLREAADELESERNGRQNDGGDDVQKKVERLLVQLTVPEGEDSNSRSLILTASNIDPGVRATAIRQIAQLLGSEETLPPAETEALRDALITRMQDSDVTVLKAVYSSPKILASVLSSTYLSDIYSLAKFGKSLCAVDTLPVPEVLERHVAFFCSTEAVETLHKAIRQSKKSKGEGAEAAVLCTLVLPYALFSLKNARVSAAVWRATCTSSIANHRLLRDVHEALEGSGLLELGEASLDEEVMANINAKLAGILAENIRASDDYPELLSWLLDSLANTRSTDAGVEIHRQLFALLVLRELLARLTGEHSLDAAHAVLQSMKSMSLHRDSPVRHISDEIQSNSELLRAIVLKPGSPATTQLVQLSVLAQIVTIQCPGDVMPAWFCVGESRDSSVDPVYAPSRAPPAERFVRIMRCAYALLNISMTKPNVMTKRSIHALLSRLGTDALLFLAGLWAVSDEEFGLGDSVPGADLNIARYVALRHGAAFLKAQIQLSGSDTGLTDFQLVLPALLSALQNENRRVRLAALDCIHELVSVVSKDMKPSSVYACDKVYGTESAALQYIDWADEVKYLTLLADHHDHLANDSEYLLLMNHEGLSPMRSLEKKETKQRQRILCFLLSHATTCPTPSMRRSILQALSRVSDRVKIQMLLPAIEALLESCPSPRAHLSASADQAGLEVLMLGAFDRTSAKELNSDDSSSWSVFLRVIRRYHALGKPSLQWPRICSNLRDSLFTSLSAVRQLELTLVLIELGSITEAGFGIKDLLKHCINQSSLMIALLQKLQPSVNVSSERAFKRQRTDSEPLEESAKTDLTRLMLLSEILAAQAPSLPGSMELVTCLLDTLNRTVSSAVPSQADVVYVEQLLMTCVETAASRIPELPSRTPNSIRLDVLVELVRTSQNPQTFNQAMLLMASLARLAPESVLHNLMPIFTFMGSNIFHRDDSYSFKVIQKTTESIVPVATASFKSKYSSGLDLFIGSKDLVRTFTDASSHIPRHRRSSFFTHLVDVLDPVHYLAPVVMLLSDKVSNRVSKQDRQGAQTTLGLPLSILHHYSPAANFSALNHVVFEVKRLTSLIIHSSLSDRTFLEIAPTEEYSVPVSTMRKRQCQTLLTLIGFGMKQMSGQMVKESGDDLQGIMTILLELAIAGEEGSSVSEVASAAEWALHQSMGIISVPTFASTVLSMLTSHNKKIRLGALELLSSRVPDMTDESRASVSAIMTQIVSCIQDILGKAVDGIHTAALRALARIGETAKVQEETSLTSTVPAIVGILQLQPENDAAMAVLKVLVIKLGPRLIPHLRSVIEVTVLSLKSSQKAPDEALTSGGIQTLSRLLKTIPSFWSVRDVRTVADLYIGSDNDASYDKLIKLLAKRIPSKIMLPSLLQRWPPLSDLVKPQGDGKFLRFFELLRRSLQFATSADVLENLREIFSHFQQSLSARSELLSEKAEPVEDKISAAFIELISKLKENTFQPMFRRLCDWAFVDQSGPEKMIAFCRLYTALLEHFKKLMTPYMSLLTDKFVDLLESYHRGKNSHKDLWFAAVQTLEKSFAVDEGAFWRDDRLTRLSASLTNQIPICITYLKLPAHAPGRALLSGTLSALLDCLDEDDVATKNVNFATLMHTRSEDARVRLFTLQCAVAMWTMHGAKLRAFGTETATFIIECAEDENDDIIRECRKLKGAVEAEVGNIDGL